MKKKIILVLVALSVLMISTSPAFPGTIKDVLNKVIEAQGGKNLRTIKDSILSGKLKVIAQGLEGTIEIVTKFPDKSKSDVGIMGMNIVQATDGRIAWADNPMQGGLKKMNEKETKAANQNAIGYDGLINPEKYGIKYVLKGKKKVEGKDYIVITKSFKNGQSSTLYIDPETHLTSINKSKRDTPQGETEITTIFSDYKKVSGVFVAHKLTQIMGGQKYVEIVFDKIEYNNGVKNSVFQMPKIPKTEKK